MGKLTDELIGLITKDGLYGDGDNLYLRKRGDNLVWFGKWVRHGKQTSIGYGPYPQISVVEARDKAAANTALMQRKEDHYRDYRRNVAPALLTGPDVAWMVPQLMTIEHVMARFAISYDYVLWLLKTKRILGRYIGRRLTLETESVFAWYNSLPAVVVEDLKPDVSKMTLEEAAAVAELINPGVAPDAVPTERLERWGVTEQQNAAERAGQHLGRLQEAGAIVRAEMAPKPLKARTRRKGNSRGSGESLPPAPSPVARADPPPRYRDPVTGKMMRVQ